MERQQKIAVVGVGYVRLSNAALLAQDNPVCAMDTQPRRVNRANRGRPPIVGLQLESRLGGKDLMLLAAADIRAAYGNADSVIAATPADYDAEQNYFDTSSVETTAEAALGIQPGAYIVIRSTVPLGSIEEISSRCPDRCVPFSPGLLREGRALYNDLYLSRVILRLGTRDPVQMKKAHMFVSLLKGMALKESAPVRYIDATEAKAVKLFSDTYLAMRVASLNELDACTEVYGLDTRNIIEDICLGPRIGTHYSNPSFGYGGYCPPKDTRQLLADCGGTPNCITTTVVQANRTGKDFIIGQMLSKSPRVAGIYRLVMKADSDSFHHSSILRIVRRLEKKGVRVAIYKPASRTGAFLGVGIISDLREFKQRPDVILADRCDRQLEDVGDKVYTRGLFLYDWVVTD